jgi:hypothetical protein
MSTQPTRPASGGFTGDPAEAFNPPAAGGCCGSPATGTGPAGGQTEVCCGTAAEAQASGGCCGEAPKTEAVASGTGCCG